MRILMFLTGIFLFVLSGADEAEAACVEKTNGAAHLIALVPDNDPGRFADQGFTVTACPPNYADLPEMAEAWCENFAALPADRKQTFQTNFGITTAQVCQAARDYFAAS